MHREAVERRGLRSWAVRGTERGLEKRRGGGGEREEIHETSIRFARTHTHGLQIIIIKVPRLCSLVPARVTRLCPPGALALLFYLHLSCIVHRTPDAPPSMAKWRCRTALSFSLSLSFLPFGSAVLGWRESGKAFRPNRMFAIERGTRELWFCGYRKFGN